MESGTENKVSSSEWIIKLFNCYRLLCCFQRLSLFVFKENSDSDSEKLFRRNKD